MIGKQKFILGLLLILLPIAAMPQELNQPTTAFASQDGSTLEIKRGQSITQNELSAMADLSSARNEKGDSVVLNDNSYEVGSFTRTTISIVPPSGKAADVITLDLINNN